MYNVTTSCRDINELLPIAQKACKLFLSECKTIGLDIFITETYRSQERQNYLYEQGRSRPGNIVTWTKSSRHTSRLAWDIACNGGVLYDNTILLKAGEVAKKLGITWGGNWSTPDKPHFEVTKVWMEPVGEEEEVKRYNTIDEVPEWGKDVIKLMIDKGAFADLKNLNLSEDMIRVFVFNSRMGMYK